MHGPHERSLPLAPQLTRLTELSISVKGSLVSALGFLTNLVSLELQIYLEVTCGLDDILRLMTCLEKVTVRRSGVFFTSTSGSS